MNDTLGEIAASCSWHGNCLACGLMAYLSTLGTAREYVSQSVGASFSCLSFYVLKRNEKQAKEPLLFHVHFVLFCFAYNYPIS